MTAALTYVIGIPGSGKSSAVDAALKDATITKAETEPFKYIRYADGIQLGEMRDGRSGTDALPYNVQPTVVSFMAKDLTVNHSQGAVVGEGDRLANTNFFRQLIYAGWEVDLVLIHVPVEVARRRCFKRRSTQAESWWQGRVTKTVKLAQRWKRFLTVVDGTKSTDEVAAHLRETIAVQRILG